VYVCLNLPAPNLGMAPRYIQMKINNYFQQECCLNQIAL
jgi:hypothetical protein